jgi:hypothetical protein
MMGPSRALVGTIFKAIFYRKYFSLSFKFNVRMAFQKELETGKEGAEE